MRHAGILLILVACEPAPASESPSRPAVKPMPVSERPKPPPRGKLQVEWGNVETTRGCFYFSGPEGRDNKLAGSDLTITIAGVGFRGAVRDGELVVTRTSTHDYGGAWTVTETISGRFVEGAVRARYRYTECEARSGACPGTCTIDADLTLR